MAEITWTEEAWRWMEDIFDYIARDSPTSAAETVQGIFDRVQILKTFPELGQRYWASSRNVRILMYGHYRIAYLTKDNKDLDILGVFHSALDITKYQL